ncbi:MAG TPA: hypothetical protein VG943_13450 [Caulobacterales bacterium]|nr:hypothetical protein [Caulobacterales bacterium]
MPADTLTVSLPAPLADEVRAAAAARGLSPEEFVRLQVAYGVGLDDEDHAFADDIAEDEASAEHYDRTGIGVPGDKVIAWLRSLSTANPLPRPAPRKLK